MSNASTKIFADGAKKDSIIEMYRNPLIAGFTTNPTLMVKAGITDYKAFALDVLSTVTDKPISFEVFSDDFEEMKLQALEIASWGENVYVKIPITNTSGQSSVPLIRTLSWLGVKVNVTAITLLSQVSAVMPALNPDTATYVSVFAGRIADCGIDPLPTMQRSLELVSRKPNTELIWASPREVFNIAQAREIGCHIITVTDDLLKKLNLIGKDLQEMSLDTVKMFYRDAVSVGYSIETGPQNEEAAAKKFLTRARIVSDVESPKQTTAAKNDNNRRIS